MTPSGATSQRSRAPLVIPIFMALMIAVAIAAAPLIESRPSSTHPIAIMTAPVVALVVAVAVFVITLVWAVVLQQWRPMRCIGRAPWVLLFAAPFCGLLIAWGADVWAEQERRPRIVHTSERVQRLTTTLDCVPVTVWDEQFMPGPGAANGLVLNSAPIHLSMPSNFSLRVEFWNGSGREHSFQFPEYITSVRAWPLGAGTAAPTALAVDLRATSSVSVLLVLSALGDVLHWEVMHRPSGASEVEVRLGVCTELKKSVLQAIGGPTLSIDLAE